MGPVKIEKQELKFNTHFFRLDEKEKAYQLADGEIQALNRKLFLEQVIALIFLKHY